MAAEQCEDLDQLLDSALDDFNNLNFTSSSAPVTAPPRSEGDDREKRQGDASLPCKVQGLGVGLPDLISKKKGKQKAAIAFKENHVSEALDKLTEQTREAVRGLEATAAAKGKVGGDDLGKEGMVDDLVKQFQEFAGTQDMESIMETMMQQLLSKEILHEPMKEIGERYPKWLKENESVLNQEDYQRYSHQYELIKELNQVYDKDPANFTRIVELMQKMQECGQPPNDIVQELAPDLDLSNLGQLSPEMLESQSNCCVM